MVGQVTRGRLYPPNDFFLFLHNSFSDNKLFRLRNLHVFNTGSPVFLFIFKNHLEFGFSKHDDGLLLGYIDGNILGASDGI